MDPERIRESKWVGNFGMLIPPYQKHLDRDSYAKPAVEPSSPYLIPLKPPPIRYSGLCVPIPVCILHVLV